MANLPQLTAIQDLLDAVTKAKTLNTSIVTFLNQLTPFIQAKVEAALTADNAADADSITAANAAIASGVTELLASTDGLETAFVANVPAGEPATPPVIDPAADPALSARKSK